jgi:hypothetical protein
VKACLGPLDLDDVAKLGSAESGYLLDTTNAALPKVGCRLCDRLVDCRRPAAGRAKRIRERDVVAPREELRRWRRVSVDERVERRAKGLDGAVSKSLWDMR